MAIQIGKKGGPQIKESKKAEKKAKKAEKKAERTKDKHDREEGKKANAKSKDKETGKKAGKVKKSKTTAATFRNITCKTCSKPVHKGGTPEGEIHKCCPNSCGTTARGEKAIEEKFGYREWEGRKIPQSYCRGCRSAKSQEYSSAKEKPAKKGKDSGKKAGKDKKKAKK